MRRSRVIALVLTWCCYALHADAQPPAGDQLQRREFELPSGMKALIIHVPGATQQTTFTFFPANLANDDAHRPQWSHLLEHMVLRTTDPDGLHPPGIMINGETTDTYLRLETFAEPDRWRESLERHARWLAAREFQPAVLAREKTAIEGEERHTASRGFTGKFAIAAWNQIVVHGLEHAAVNRAVQDAKLDDLTAYASQRINANPRTLLATIGPAACDEVEAAIRELIDAHASQPNKAADQNDDADHLRVQPARLIAEDDSSIFRATWDLPTTHVIMWWPLPDDQPQTLAAATGAMRALLRKQYQQGEVQRTIRSILPHAIVRSSAGPMMCLNACVHETADVDAFIAALRRSASSLAQSDAATMQAIAQAAMTAANEFLVEPDFKMLAQQLPQTMRDSVEGVWLLGVLNCERAWQINARDARMRLLIMDDSTLTLASQLLRASHGVLVLKPAAPAAPTAAPARPAPAAATPSPAASPPASLPASSPRP